MSVCIDMGADFLPGRALPSCGEGGGPEEAAPGLAEAAAGGRAGPAAQAGRGEQPRGGGLRPQQHLYALGPGGAAAGPRAAGRQV